MVNGTCQAGTHVSNSIKWLVPMLSLPGGTIVMHELKAKKRGPSRTITCELVYTRSPVALIQP